MTAIEDARAALADLRAGIPQRGDYPEYDREHEDLDKIAALIAEHERLTARTCERCRWNAGFGAREPIGGHDPSCPISAVMAEARTAPPTDDEREALIAEALECIQPSQLFLSTEPGWIGTTRDVVRARRLLDRALTTGFRRQGPITEEMVEAFTVAINRTGYVLDRRATRVGLEAAERAR